MFHPTNMGTFFCMPATEMTMRNFWQTIGCRIPEGFSADEMLAKGRSRDAGGISLNEHHKKWDMLPEASGVPSFWPNKWYA